MPRISTLGTLKILCHAHTRKFTIARANCAGPLFRALWSDMSWTRVTRWHCPHIWKAQKQLLTSSVPRIERLCRDGDRFTSFFFQKQQKTKPTITCPSFPSCTGLVFKSKQQGCCRYWSRLPCMAVVTLRTKSDGRLLVYFQMLLIHEGIEAVTSSI